MAENGDPKEPSEKSFADLVGEEVRPLAPGRAPPRRTPVSRPASPESTPPFQIELTGEEFTGRAPGVSRRELRRFGDVAEPIAEVDLHGLTSDEARAALFEALATAREQGRRWLHVVHGKGLHSGGEAVLKKALPEWLTQPPHAAAVLAFRCSRRLPGATGATRVWLRREGQGARGSR